MCASEVTSPYLIDSRVARLGRLWYTRLTLSARSTRAVGVVFAGTLSACALIPDLGGLTGAEAPDAAVIPDGGTPDASPDVDAGGDAAKPDGGVATCPPYVLPAQCDSKYLSDGKNCCIPGRDCQGGACINGKCQPVIIVPDATTDARVIKVAGDLLVWATGCTGVVRKVGKDGAGNTPLPKGANCTPTVAVSGASVYWIEYNGPFLNTAPIDGSQPVRIVAEVPIAGAKADFARLAVDATRAYWVEATPPSIWYAPLNGDHVTPVPLASSVASGLTKETVAGPYGVAVDATHVYWSDKSGGSIKRRALSTLGQDILADLVINESGPGELALDATNVYYVTNGGFVRTRDKDAKTSALTLAFGQASPESIVVDDVYAYWVNSVQNGTVSRAPKSGAGNVEVLATGQKRPYSVTQDCTTVYWTNQNDFGVGQIVKVVK